MVIWDMGSHVVVDNHVLHHHIMYRFVVVGSGSSIITVGASKSPNITKESFSHCCAWKVSCFLKCIELYERITIRATATFHHQSACMHGAACVASLQTATPSTYTLFL